MRPILLARRRALPARPRGAALLTAMILVTVVATLAAGMLWQQWRALQVEAAERTQTQAQWLLQGAMDWSRMILREDARSGGTDHLNEPWAAPLAALAQEYPQLAVEVLTAPQADALAMLHTGRAQLALVFERPSLDGREGFQEVATETLLAVVAPSHPMMQTARAEQPAHGKAPQLREHHLTNTRQIVVASRDWTLNDERLVYARDVWRTDNHGAALRMISAGIGWGWLPQKLVAPQLQAGELVAMEFANLSNGAQLYVDVVWSKAHPQGLATQRFVALVQAAAANEA